VQLTDLEAADLTLFDRAAQVLAAAHHPSRHQVAAAMLGESGAVYVGLHVGSRRINVCAESSALASACIAGELRVSTVVAVCLGPAGAAQVTNPCGVCRELLGGYCPDASVLVDVGGAVRKARLAELLPLPWLRAEETGWTVAAPALGTGSDTAGAGPR
jgi:cytidine deaminase